MNALPVALLSNALIAAALSMLAALVGRWCKNPSAVHLLWLLVIVKLVTPPLVSLPVPGVAIPFLPLEPGVSENLAADAVVAAALVPATVQAPLDNTAAWPVGILLFVWLAGSALFLVTSGIRIHRFSCLLADARPAGASLTDKTQRLSRQLGLSSTPPVLIVRARISPLVRGLLSGPQIILPEGLLARLDERGITSLLAHELAHIKRKDHWVRLIEVTATSIFWWYPVLWWARRRMHESEELSTDAMALELLTENPARYAHALMDTAEFLRGHQPTPMTSNWETGSCKTLRRRLNMIMLEERKSEDSYVPRLALACLAVVFLPLSATAQNPSPSPTPKPQAAEEQKVDSEEIRRSVEKALKEIDIEATVAQALEAASVTLRELNIQAIIDQSLESVETAEAMSAIDKAKIHEEVQRALQEVREAQTILEEVRKEIDSGKIKKAVEEALKEIDKERITLEAQKAAQKKQESSTPPRQ